MFVSSQFFLGPFFYIFPSLILVAIVALVVVLAVRGRRMPDPLGRRVEAAYMFSAIFAIGLLGLGALALTAHAIGAGMSGPGKCVSGGPRQIRGEIAPRPETPKPPIPRFTIPPLPEFRLTFPPFPQPEVTVSPASNQIRQPIFVCPGRRPAVARGVRGAMHLGAAAIGVVWFGNRARELLAKEKIDDA